MARSWSPRLLRAAFWVGRVLGPEGEDAETAHRSWGDLPLGGTVDFAELRAAERALIEIGLVERDGDELLPASEFAACTAGAEEENAEPLLALVLEREAPLWLRTAVPDDATVRSELLPEDARAALAGVIPDPGRREAFLLARARKIATLERELLGGEGEEAVVAACRAQLTELGAGELAAAVRRVSLVSDELGYDLIAPRTDNSVRRLEVKSTRSPGATVRLFITRNEVTVGLADPDWFLVVARRGKDGEWTVLGHTAAASLQTLLPVDCDTRGRWQMAVLVLTIEDLESGLPPA
jgi:hypothetical protein